MFDDMQSEANFGNYASFLKAGHAFLDLKIDPAVLGKCKKVVLRDDLVRDVVEKQTYVLIAVHGCIII